MEQKNENEFLILKNYSQFLIDLGLNISFSHEINLKMKQYKKGKNLKSIIDINNYVKKWQNKNNFQLISRNDNISSNFFLLLSEENNFTNFDQFKRNQPELLDKMFASIGQNVNDFFVINIDLAKIKESHLNEINEINEILNLYFAISNPKIFIDMCSEDLGNFFEVNKLNVNFNYFKIPSVSNIMKNQSLKREAWVQLKSLKAKLDEF